jgi:hypothetical protein
VADALATDDPQTLANVLTARERPENDWIRIFRYNAVIGCLSRGNGALVRAVTHPYISAYALNEIFSCPDVVEFLFQNPGTFMEVTTSPCITVEVLEAIFRYPDAVRFLRQNADILAQNPCTTPYLWIQLIEANPDTVDRLLRDLDAFIGVITSQYITVDVLAAIFSHPDAAELLLRNAEVFIEIVTNQNIIINTLNAIFRLQAVVDFFRRDRDAFIRMVTDPRIDIYSASVFMESPALVQILDEYPELKQRIEELTQFMLV